MKLRFVKFLTSLENEIEKKEGGGGRSTALACSVTHSQAAAIAPLPLPLPPPFITPFSLPPPSPTSPHRPAPACRPPRVGRAMPSSYPSPSCSASPFLLHKLLKPQSVAVVTWRAPSSPAQLQRRPACQQALLPRCPTCPPSPPLSPLSRSGPSTSSGAIGKQRPKMNYPVSSPLLMNK